MQEQTGVPEDDLATVKGVHYLRIELLSSALGDDA
jgi:hypothetical protein